MMGMWWFALARLYACHVPRFSNGDKQYDEQQACLSDFSP